ncbi:MAG: putative DNA binding domain-containing protein [Lachnospiraceae bacterium]|nr:putative DNA binding domain-containing protein [Lachnospiraceae bacterium]
MNNNINLKNLIGEATEYDKKQAVEMKKPKSWCKSVSAFANSSGGALIFGIADDGGIVGLDNPDSDAEKISEIIKSRLDPIPEFKLRFEQVDDRTVIILDIMPGGDTPYYYSADGALEAYIRVGNESVKATSMEQKRLIMKGRNMSFDTQVSSYKASDYAFSKLRERYKKWTGKSFEDKDMISFGLVTDEGYLTNAGALLADECPIWWSRVFCTRWNGLNKSGGTLDALDDSEFSGSLIYLLENGEEFIKRNCRKMWRKTPNSREEMPEYVERSYHEALINALVHRDYLVNGSEVHIDIFDDRMEIYSPGGMADGIAIQDRDPLSVPSTRRNPLLADIFERLGYMERKGSGFGKILDAYEFQVNYKEDKKPSFRSDRASFFTTMPNLNYDIKGVPQGVPQDVPQDVPQEGIDDRIISLIRENKDITTEEIASILNVSSKTIKRHIEKMPNVKYVGSGYSGHWEITDNQ